MLLSGAWTVFPQELSFSVQSVIVIHRKNVFHDREAMIDGFFKPIQPTSVVVVDTSGHYQLS